MTGSTSHEGVASSDYPSQQLRAAEARARAAEARAILAEEREQAHQDKWAVEIHALRQQLAQHEASMRAAVYRTRSTIACMPPTLR